MKGGFALAAGLMFAVPILVATGPARAEPCKPSDGRTSSRRPMRCGEPAAKLEPYDPDRQPSGARPGTIDLGNGTEVRIGGRTRLEYDQRR